MPAAAGKKQHSKQVKNQDNKQSGVLTHREYKQKPFQEQPDVKKEYDALEEAYQREVAKIKQVIANG
jgi:esterase/lipase